MIAYNKLLGANPNPNPHPYPNANANPKIGIMWTNPANLPSNPTFLDHWGGGPTPHFLTYHYPSP